VGPQALLGTIIQRKAFAYFSTLEEGFKDLQNLHKIYTIPEMSLAGKAELPPNPTHADIRKHKSRIRQWDSHRIASGQATPMEVQSENTAFQSASALQWDAKKHLSGYSK